MQAVSKWRMPLFAHKDPRPSIPLPSSNGRQRLWIYSWSRRIQMVCICSWQVSGVLGCLSWIGEQEFPDQIYKNLEHHVTSWCWRILRTSEEMIPITTWWSRNRLLVFGYLGVQLLVVVSRSACAWTSLPCFWRPHAFQATLQGSDRKTSLEYLDLLLQLVEKFRESIVRMAIQKSLVGRLG